MSSRTVNFSRGSSSSFPALVKDSNTLYFISDTHEIYLGNTRFAFGDDTTIIITGEGDCIADAVYNQTTKKLVLIRGDAGSKESVIAAIEAAVADCVKTISSDRGSSILVDSTDPEHISLSLNLAQGASAGNVILEECSDGLRGTVSIPEQIIARVKSDDKVLKIDSDKNLSATLSLHLERDGQDNAYIVLKGVSGAEVSRLDASDFIKSGLIQSASIEDKVIGGEIHQVLVLVFSIAGGGTERFEIDLNSLVDVYKAGTGLRLQNNTFSIDNVVEAYDGVEPTLNPSFGDTLTFKTTRYDASGLVLGHGTQQIKLPNLSGYAGNENNTKLLTYVTIDDGVMSGQSLDVSSAINVSSTDNQIPTAKSVYDTIQSVVPTWERI